MKILVLDDDKICRRVTSESLRRAGYDTIEASSAKEAFELLDKGEPIVMILTDIRMPEMSGVDFVARLRSDPGLAKIPIIICTSLETKAWLDEVGRFGISAHSPKPVNANHLRGKIGNILQEEPWPLEETFRTLTRLDISVEDYFASLDDLIKQLDDLSARSDNQSQPMNREDLAFELEALAGAAENLGAKRIAGVLTGETEIVRAIADGQKVAVSATLKRETGMLRLAMLILKKENDETVAARKAGRVVTRQGGKEARWKTVVISKQPPPSAPDPPASETAAASESAQSPAPAPSETPSAPSGS